MAYDLKVFTESQAANGLTAFAPLADAVTGYEVSNTDFLRLKDRKNQLAAVYGLGANLARARITSPSLRSRNRLLEVAPLDAAAEPSSRPPLITFPDPIPLDQGELVNVDMDNGNTAERDFLAMWLSDGPIQPIVPRGIVVRATATATLTANTFTEVTPTLDTALGPGRYKLEHVRAQSAGAIFWRVHSKDEQRGSHRPGGIAFDAVADVEPVAPGGYGLLDEFTETTFPGIEIYSISADTAETFWFWIRKVA